MYVADTHALVKYLIDALPKKTANIFTECEKGIATIFIPTIVLAESYYLIRKKKIALDFEQLITKIEKSHNFNIMPFDLGILKLFPTVKRFEIHDQIIVATTKYLGATLITKDKAISRSKIVRTVW